MADGANPGRPLAPEASRLAQQSADAFDAAADIDDPTLKAEKLEEARDAAGDSALADAYTYLQKAVGLIAVLLPFTVAIGNLVFGGHGLKGSISAYYYTPMGNVFVGSLCALAVFFLSYNYRPLPSFELDNLLSTAASVAALGVAFFPTTSDSVTASNGEKMIAVVHLICACALFVLLAVFSLFLFTRSAPNAPVTDAKKRRNLLYRICGGIIVGAIVLVVVSNAVSPPKSWHALFWLESIAVVAFGVSWLVKGGFLGILADRAPVGAAAGRP
jgi:hypothetical protein